MEFSPFLANRDNPFDRNANSKCLKQRFDNIKLDANKRNILALVEQDKKPKIRETRYGYSAPKRGNASLDINDILRYTLGVQR